MHTCSISPYSCIIRTGIIYHSTISSIKTTYFKHLIDGIQQNISNTDDGFADFLMDVDKSKIFSYAKEKEADHDTGLISREGEKAHDGHYDHKDFFHFRIELQNHAMFAEYQKWLNACGKLLKKCRVKVREFVEELDRQLPGYNFVEYFCNDATLNDDVLRIIHYRKTRPDTKLIARRHRGKAGFVLALSENYPGLQGLIHNSWIPLSSRPNCPLIFAGLKMEQITNEKIKALDHEAIHVKGAEKVQRRSIVAFVNPKGVELTLPTH
ncbi:MAG: hypothetical protein IH946_02010 [Bacteroidetes bacterium]|nr:hypothetical protein [Bacteroidota bacterium]